MTILYPSSWSSWAGTVSYVVGTETSGVATFGGHVFNRGIVRGRSYLLATVTVVRWSGPLTYNSWGYNVWLYTRWGAWCWGVCTPKTALDDDGDEWMNETTAFRKENACTK